MAGSRRAGELQTPRQESEGGVEIEGRPNELTSSSTVVTPWWTPMQTFLVILCHSEQPREVEDGRRREGEKEEREREG
jgi:hypothetical protein